MLLFFLFSTCSAFNVALGNPTQAVFFGLYAIGYAIEQAANRITEAIARK